MVGSFKVYECRKALSSRPLSHVAYYLHVEDATWAMSEQHLS